MKTYQKYNNSDKENNQANYKKGKGGKNEKCLMF
jgi:hypothetical protein